MSHPYQCIWQWPTVTMAYNPATPGDSLRWKVSAYSWEGEWSDQVLETLNEAVVARSNARSSSYRVEIIPYLGRPAGSTLC
jgi:hypothetical protein